MSSTLSSDSSSAAVTHPFASSTSRLVLLPNTIDLEEESRLYEELCEGNNAPSIRSQTRSSSAPPSILSRESIFLRDNTGESLTFARDVNISGWTNVGDELSGAYVVYDCAIKTREGTTMHVHKRYSEFVKLNSALERTLPRHLLHFVPILPPKAPLARYRPTFLDRRRLRLQYWLSAILLHPEIGGSKAVRQWVTD